MIGWDFCSRDPLNWYLCTLATCKICWSRTVFTAHWPDGDFTAGFSTLQLVRFVMNSKINLKESAHWHFLFLCDFEAIRCNSFLNFVVFQPLKNDKFVVPKSRYDCIDMYISPHGERYNDQAILYDEGHLKLLLDAGKFGHFQVISLQKWNKLTANQI